MTLRSPRRSGAIRAWFVAVAAGAAGAIVPWVVIVRGWRPPGVVALRDAWRRQDVPSEVVIDLAVTMFLVLWIAACVAAVVEAIRLGSALRAGRMPATRGRSGIGSLVRLVVLSGATAASGLGTAAFRVDGVDAAQSTARSGSLVIDGEVDAVPGPDIGSFVGGLASALFLSAGAVAAVEARRRRALRTTGAGTALVPPPRRLVSVERALRSVAVGDRLVRLDMTLRAAGRELGTGRASVVAAEVDDSGTVTIHLSAAASPRDVAWSAAPDGLAWTLGAHITIEELSLRSIGSAHPCPAVLHVGRTEEGTEFFVDLESVGSMVVDSPFAEEVLHTMAASLALSPFLDSATIVTVGLREMWPGASRCRSFDSPAEAWGAASVAAGSAPLASSESSTFALRSRGDEAWEPSVVVSVGASWHDIPSTRDVLAGGRGVGVLSDTPVAGNRWRLVHRAGAHALEPLDRRIRPVGVSSAELRSVHELVEHGEVASGFGGRVVEADDEGSGPVAPFVEREWRLMVRCFGGVSVVDERGRPVVFDRSKSLELLAWLVHHRQRPTRSGARTALWDSDVRDATFANVVSEARRALNFVVLPPDGDDWLGRTLTDELPLHALVVSDAELVEARLQCSRSLGARAAIEVLRPAMDLIDGMPFAGTGFLWNDGEGITSSLVVLATAAAAELARRHLEVGDVEGVFRATERGLRVLSGHEELIALRMQAHANRGDLSGVRAEWANYERALAADPWCPSDPAPKLVTLRQTLLSPSSASGKPASPGK